MKAGHHDRDSIRLRKIYDFKKTVAFLSHLCYNKVHGISGALAQLGAHNTGSVGVRGSNPLRSTKQKPLLSEGQKRLLQ